ncbi:MAG: hypothetical protein ACRCV9_11575, partial [Burkholderiaceae bacterium]
MSFKFIPKDALRPWPIRGTKLDENSKEQNFDFLAKFRKMSAAEWVAGQQEPQHVLKNMRESTALDPAAAIPGSRDIELCRRVLHGWQMV